MNTIKTNDIKKGVRIKLRCGWYATMFDNQKGNTRLADVEGYEREIGSVYSHDIVGALVSGEWYSVEHTPQQLKLRSTVGALGF